jgi:hypothetical protein
MLRFQFLVSLAILLAFSPMICLGDSVPDAGRLVKIVETLASPEYEGRLVGSQANREARAWIREEAESAGLRPLEDWKDPLQLFQVRGYRWEKLEAKLFPPLGEAHTVVLVSKGPAASLPGATLAWDASGPAPLCENREILFRQFNPMLGESTSDLLDEAASVGAGALLLLPHPDDSRNSFSRYRARSASGDKSVYFLPGASSRPLLLYGDEKLGVALDTTLKPGKWRFELPSAEPFTLEAGNLLFRLPNSSSGQHVLLIAHYDHLGLAEEGYYPGANDNGSGVAVLLETARMIKRRSYPFELHFLFTDGEEEGYLGAKAYLENMDAPALTINLDTVGRSGVDHYRKLGDPEAFSPDLLMLWSSEENAATKSMQTLAASLQFDIRRGEGPIFERAGDHFPFAQAGLPSLFLFGGFHPDYHQPGDTPDHVLPNKLANICSLLVDFLDEAAKEDLIETSH